MELDVVSTQQLILQERNPQHGINLILLPCVPPASLALPAPLCVLPYEPAPESQSRPRQGAAVSRPPPCYAGG
jgi:hypothetical protein